MRTFFSIFNENSRDLRIDFFKNEIIQLLWTKFVRVQAAVIEDFMLSFAKQSQAGLRKQ